MRNISIVFALIFLFTNCEVEKSKNTKQSDIEQIGVNGKIRSIRHYQRQASKQGKDLIIEERWSNHAYNYYTVFNELGYKTEENRYFPNGLWKNKTVSQYNPDAILCKKKHFRIHQAVVRVDNEGNPIDKINTNEIIFSGFTEYRNFKDSIEEATYREDSSLRWRYIKEFDKNGNEIKNTEYNHDNLLKSRIEKKYDNQNNEIEFSVFNSDGSLWYTLKNKYDEMGNKTEEINLDIDGNIKFKNSYGYKYDDKNRLIEEIYYVSRGTIIEKKTTYKYDDRNNIIEKCGINANDMIIESIVSEYNQHNDKISKKTYNQFGLLETEVKFIIEYDTLANWIKKFKFNKTKNYGIVSVRELEYYN